MIYFAQAAEGGLIKIGFTDDLDARLRSLRASYRIATLRYLGVREGGRSHEREIHALFGDLRQPFPRPPCRGVGEGEWFRPGPDLLAYIGGNARPWDAPQGPAGLVSVRVGEPVYQLVRTVAAWRGVNVSDYLSEIAEPAARRDLAEIQQAAGAAGPAPQAKGGRRAGGGGRASQG